MFKLEITDMNVFERFCALLRGENPDDKTIKHITHKLKKASNNLKTVVQHNKGV